MPYAASHTVLSYDDAGCGIVRSPVRITSRSLEFSRQRIYPNVCPRRNVTNGMGICKGNKQMSRHCIPRRVLTDGIYTQNPEPVTRRLPELVAVFEPCGVSERVSLLQSKPKLNCLSSVSLSVRKKL
ncbi:hypothetical protein DPMN_125414 [Dreissena polymorpha]|uniref:Uncharacterized protein n=1 Tax=Dreissena polymorpha TaxID=45954 RepID=A0A9D4GXR6_DREPO|nr:hypothetical protein DPMN_125414 [Dreissena polymorpha]